MFEHYPDVLTVNDLCDALHIGKTSAYRLLAKGEIGSIRIGPQYRIPKKWLIDYLYKHAS